MVAYPEYTRSRDALKSIRPKKWPFIKISVDEGGISWASFSERGMNANDQQTRIVGHLRSEELAELHAVVQVIEYAEEHSGHHSPPRTLRRASPKDRR